MDFSWTSQQTQIKKTAATFAREILNSGIPAGDRDSKFSVTGWKKCAEFGLQGMVIPKKFGGAGYKLFDILAALEGIGYGCRDNGLIFSINAHIWGTQIPVLLFGSDMLKKRYLPGLAGESLIGANAMTESDTGSDVFSLSTRAVREKDYYVLTGNKTFVSNAPVADVFIVYARTGKNKGWSGISCFLVEKNTEGLQIGKNLEKMGLRTSPMAEVHFDGCKIKSKNLVGQEGNGAIIFNTSMEWERIFILAHAIGIMERLIDTCVEYAGTRKVAGQPIAKYQAVAHSIAEMKARLESSRLILYKSVWLKSKNRSAMLESAITKFIVSESYIHICREAVQVFGGYGYMTEYQLERELRDALASSIYSGTREIQKNIIAGAIGL